MYKPRATLAKWTSAEGFARDLACQIFVWKFLSIIEEFTDLRKVELCHYLLTVGVYTVLRFEINNTS